jgi:hypothetical protein
MNPPVVCCHDVAQVVAFFANETPAPRFKTPAPRPPTPAPRPPTPRLQPPREEPSWDTTNSALTPTMTREQALAQIRG